MVVWAGKLLTLLVSAFVDQKWTFSPTRGDATLDLLPAMGVATTDFLFL